MKHIQPYSDDRMLYNEETKQYELKLSWVKANYGNPYNDDNTLSVRIKRNTRKVYNYIFSHGFSGNRKAILAIINHTEEYRQYIFDALSSQIEADLASGYNDQDHFVARSVDERNMQLINQVSAETETVLKSAMGYGGINLLFASAFHHSVYLEFWSEIQ